jgi:Xaa-Pro aminopeptidase
VQVSFDHAGRVKRVRELMGDRGLDLLLLSVGADLPYFTGYQAMPLERLTMLVIPEEGQAVLVVPQLEAPRVTLRPEVFHIRPWSETEDPVAVVADCAAGARRAAVGDQTWSVFLLGLQEKMPDVRFEPATPITRELRMRKDRTEVDLLRRAAQAADRVVERLRQHPFLGKTERRLSQEIGEMTVEEGHDTASLAIVAAGPNAASPHHEPADRVIAEGDGVVVDFGGRVAGYHSDTTRTFFVGQPDPDFREAYRALARAQQSALEAVRPGVTAQSVDRAARAVIEGAGYGEYFVHRTGHGIGLEGHEHPYLVEGNDLPLEAGMAFSVEPGIYLPGRFGMRIEDIVVVTDDGVERLNLSDRSLAILS